VKQELNETRAKARRELIKISRRQLKIATRYIEFLSFINIFLHLQFWAFIKF